MEVIKAIDFKACVPVAITQSVIKMMPDAMVVGRCRDCKHFKEAEPILGGLVETNSKCSNHFIMNGAMTHLEAMYVSPDFGCVEWEAREK